MEKLNKIEDFSNLYPLSKTLRFELIPVGKTLENIEKRGVLEDDIKRAENYKIVKKILDELHKDFIHKVLSSVSLKTKNLSEYSHLLKKLDKDDKDKKLLKKMAQELRKEIAKSLTTNEEYDLLWSEELFNSSKKNKREHGLLYNKIEQEPEFKRRLINIFEVSNDFNFLEPLSDFESFSTYFKGFHDNRKNMYSDEEQQTAIAYRVINQNLHIFIENIRTFEKVRESEIKDSFPFISSKDQLGFVLGCTDINNIFKLESFNSFLTQEGIDKYNQLIGGISIDEKKEKIKGLNEYINLYNQKNPSNKISRFKPLYKQILSDRTSLSFIPDEYISDNELVESVYQFSMHIKNSSLDDLEILLKEICQKDLKTIYLKNDSGLTEISRNLFNDWNTINRAIDNKFEDLFPKRKNEDENKYEKRREKYKESFDSFSISYLNELDLPEGKKIEHYFINEVEIRINAIKDIYDSTLELLSSKYSEDRNLSQDQESINKIKKLLDSFKDLERLVKPLFGSGVEADKDALFYGSLGLISKEFEPLTPLYNKVRNYLTKKPYSTEKIKLNFDNSTLLSGWDVNKEESNLAIILKKEGDFFLGIIEKKHNKIFKDISKPKTATVYLKMKYKLLPGASKMLPKVFFSDKKIKFFNPSNNIMEIRNHSSHTKHGEPQDGFKKREFNLNDCHEMINFFKESIAKHEEWNKFNFKFSSTEQYNSIDEFYREVESQGYSILYDEIDTFLIEQYVNEGKLFLFRIYNKDFSSHSKGTPNLHTMYWRALFDDNNLKDVIYKLNGEAEVFYRKASIKPNDVVTHKAGQIIDNKNENNIKKNSVFKYDITKNRRYTVDKFQFHVPITMNFKAKEIRNINPLVNQVLKDNGCEHIIGIDRGERNLLYLCLINMHGKIVKQMSLNDILTEYKDKQYKTNYHDLLNQREGQRAEARKSWETIQSIKELKEGYLSQVIHIISEMIIKYKAVVVLEDLNFGFMRGRQKVEKQIYQKFEKMLIDKLNYYVDMTCPYNCYHFLS